MYYLGIDIGGTSVKIGLVNKNGEILKSSNYRVNFDNYDTPIFETVKKSIKIFLRDNNILEEYLKGIGISATGQVNSNSGTIVGVGGNIKNWIGTEIKKEIEEIYKIKTTVINDANSMVVAEKWIGKAKGYNNVIGITIGTGVGGGIIVDSKILLGHIGIAGELGHFSIDINGRKCTCGNTGCYEQYASMTALIKEVTKKYSINNNLSIKKEEINGKYIFEELENENLQIKEIVDNWIENIGKGLVGLTHIFNPEIILIGGAVSKQEVLLIEPLRKYIKNHVMTKFGERLKIESADLGNDAGLVGAVYYNINN